MNRSPPNLPIYVSTNDAPPIRTHKHTYIKTRDKLSKSRSRNYNRRNNYSDAKSSRDQVHDIHEPLYLLPINSQSCTASTNSNEVVQQEPGKGEIYCEQAAANARRCLQAQKNTRAARTLEKVLNRDLDLDAKSLDDQVSMIGGLADKVFFNNRLRGRMNWKWSEEGEKGYGTEYLGTTTPRYLYLPQRPEGVRHEASVVLSRPLLQNGTYKSSLLMSTFLHELVHCYLFVCCGKLAEKDGGHTQGFKEIVEMIERWLDNQELRLCSMKADLDHFVNDDVLSESYQPVCYVYVMDYSQDVVVMEDDGDYVLVGQQEGDLSNSMLNSPLRKENEEPMWVGSPWSYSGDETPTFSFYGQTPVSSFCSDYADPSTPYYVSSPYH